MSKPMFTEEDYAVVSRAMTELNEKEMTIVFLRFWGPYSLCEIGNFLKMPYDRVDYKLKKALRKLKKHCLMNSDFSRSLIRTFSIPNFAPQAHFGLLKGVLA